MTAERRRVVITGAGAVTPLGLGREVLWDGLLDGSSGAARIDVEGVGSLAVFPVAGLAEAAEERFGRRAVRRMDRVGQMAALAGALALDDAGELDADAGRIGAVVGCVHGGVETALDAHRTFLERGADRVGPLSVPLALPNGAAAAMARTLGLRGPSNAPATACAAGTDAIGLGLDLIRAGRADVVLAGGAEAPISPVPIAGYLRMGALSGSTRPAREVSRPFADDRDGFVIGEGAGVVVLEERERALARGARILGEVAGYGTTCDAGHLTDPDADGEGAALAMRAALADAGLVAEDIGYINAHATSTLAGDAAEAEAIQRAGLATVPVSSTKSAHGHGLGAAGGVELIAALVAFGRDVLPPTLNLDHPGVGATLNHLTAPRQVRIDAFLSNSFGFGGHNACIAVRRA